MNKEDIKVGDVVMAVEDIFAGGDGLNPVAPLGALGDVVDLGGLVRVVWRIPGRPMTVIVPSRVMVAGRDEAPIVQI